MTAIVYKIGLLCKKSYKLEHFRAQNGRTMGYNGINRSFKDSKGGIRGDMRYFYHVYRVLWEGIGSLWDRLRIDPWVRIILSIEGSLI